MEPHLIRKTDVDSVYFIVHWSTLRKADRHDIISVIPSVPGVYELYYRDERKVMRLVRVARAWYGGLRNTLREVTDPDLQKDTELAPLWAEYDAYYRFVPVPSHADMADLLFFFAETYFPRQTSKQPSGRYEHIYVEEVSPEKVIDLD